MKIKKGGYSNTFIDELIKDKAERLAFYFIINYNIYDYKYINHNNLFKLCNITIDKYHQTIDILNKNHMDSKHNYNIYDYLNLLYLINLNNHITKTNYGTEGHILNFLIDSNSKKFYKILEYYIELFKNVEVKIEITIEKFFEKIGIDIAIYSFIFNYNYDINLFIHDFIEKYFKIFINEKQKYNQILDYINSNNKNKLKEDNPNCIFNINDNKIIKYQQYYNMYKYKTNYLNNDCIIYINTVILKFNIPDFLIDEIDEIDL